MGRKTLGGIAASLIVFGACAQAAGASGGSLSALIGRLRPFPALPGLVSQRATGVRPRIGGAMGIIAPSGKQEIAVGANIPVLYHGGAVMRGVTIHTIFWAPAGFQFEGAPPGSRSYVQLVQQFFTDVAHDSGSTGNAFSVLDQYGDGAGHGLYAISYNVATDSIEATDPYPSKAHQCASPSGVATCVTDLELQTEIDHIITTHSPHGRGLHDLWFIFLPPNVDTCTSAGECATTVFAGYHGLSNVGHGPVVYAAVPDPLVEGVSGQGGDPEGNPEAEVTIDTAAHETVEAITNPEGVGWMDPNGLEVGDKCENGPQEGNPLGFAANGSPYNQVINGHQYLIQGMWSNAVTGCVQSAGSTGSTTWLATVRMTQFSPVISGNIGTRRRGVQVAVLLARGGLPVAGGTASTGAAGGWAVSLRALGSSGGHAVGDDRDEILVAYGSHGPKPDLIETGDGGNPFTAAGWTGWFDLDTGFEVENGGVALGPCSQTGVLTLRIGGVATQPPIERCETETDIAVLHSRPIRPRTPVTLSSEDNRAVSAENPAGALVKLTVSLGEPGSVAAIVNPNITFLQTGLPACTADLQAQTVHCSGLVLGERYSLTRRRRHIVRRATAGFDGTVAISGLGIRGGDELTLTNSARRRLTTLHVAHLRVDIIGRQTVIASGNCQPGDYYGAPLTSLPASPSVDSPGAGGTGTVCPPDGGASGLSTADIEQTDDFSGGQTRTEVPNIEATSPVSGETLYGPFIASAQIALPGPNGSLLPALGDVALTITPAGARQPVLRLGNVAVTQGVAVPGLVPGLYDAKWVLTDANGDTRTIRTRFAEEG